MATVVVNQNYIMYYTRTSCDITGGEGRGEDVLQVAARLFTSYDIFCTMLSDACFVQADLVRLISILIML